MAANVELQDMSARPTDAAAEPRARERRGSKDDQQKLQGESSAVARGGGLDGAGDKRYHKAESYPGAPPQESRTEPDNAGVKRRRATQLAKSDSVPEPEPMRIKMDDLDSTLPHISLCQVRLEYARAFQYKPCMPHAWSIIVHACIPGYNVAQ